MRNRLARLRAAIRVARQVYRARGADTLTVDPGQVIHISVGGGGRAQPDVRGGGGGRVVYRGGMAGGSPTGMTGPHYGGVGTAR